MQKFIALIIIIINGVVNAQQFSTNGALLLKAQITLGNQNQGVKIGAYGVANGRFGDIALEAGAGIYAGYVFKRHNAKTSDIHFGYDLFSLAGLGKNDNLLVSSFFIDTPLLLENQNNQNFYGFGLGFEKEFLPHDLSEFDQRLAKFLLRFANANHSINIQFKNDLKLGRLVNGEGTDFGNTGSLYVSYSTIQSPFEAYLFGIGLQLFTPEADYSLTPNNPINSDDGSKNVWFTKGKHPHLFYANLFGFGSYQDEGVYVFAKAGVNSQKLGAYIQNTLHDSFGLNPRYPWDVSASDKLFVEGGIGLFIPENND